MWTDVCGCFSAGQTSLVPDEALREHGKDLPVSQEQGTFVSIHCRVIRKK
jgi:hypothetical protein